ncbi:bifunctional enoyl-CoA hydratase/phosphate acetyltransferase [Evansella sp. AB-P1]|uniref:bifunctional enoyl-CoA hydratase/phosphate acetyltransferase n=1 Tax=Evansella sp. AB-P1 TaxID=3037653 RepID=UPI00241C06AC|nr:bifunctional enoyl-CoA hydratase/phosphate acetyltransferase [Evansella sp. AB-P1]MDG5788672.1 bifunctional enoyl-CoA hydratase/phosphate acetyltransferase [Evansella sp. AB-P1]
MNLETLITAIKSNQNCRTIVVAHATDITLFLAAKQALDERLASFIFVGPSDLMTDLAKEVGLFQGLDENERIRFVHSDNDISSANQAVQLVRKGEGDIVMKGMLATSLLLKAVLNKDFGLRTGNVLSHLAGFSLSERDSFLFVTDAAINIAPDLNGKVQILQNAVEAVGNMGINEPKVAVIAAVETVNTSMQATLDAAALTMMNRRGQIKQCVVDGPLALDNAVSVDAAKQKGIDSKVAGYADIIIVPSIEVGNVLYKSLTIFGKAIVGGIIVGAKAPIILTSRADSIESKMLSMTMALSTVTVD